MKKILFIAVMLAALSCYAQTETNEIMVRLEAVEQVITNKALRYIVKFDLRQSHFTMSLSTHAKDAMNATQFELPVDAQFYNEVQIGQMIHKDFRTGSFLLYGSFGNWKLKVIGKRVEQL